MPAAPSAPRKTPLSLLGWRVRLDFQGRRLIERGFRGDEAVTLGEGAGAALCVPGIAAEARDGATLAAGDWLSFVDGLEGEVTIRGETRPWSDLREAGGAALGRGDQATLRIAAYPDVVLHVDHELPEWVGWGTRLGLRDLAQHLALGGVLVGLLALLAQVEEPVTVIEVKGDPTATDTALARVVFASLTELPPPPKVARPEIPIEYAAAPPAPSAAPAPEIGVAPEAEIEAPVREEGELPDAGGVVADSRALVGVGGVEGGGVLGVLSGEVEEVQYLAALGTADVLKVQADDDPIGVVEGGYVGGLLEGAGGVEGGVVGGYVGGVVEGGVVEGGVVGGYVGGVVEGGVVEGGVVEGGVVEGAVVDVGAVGGVGTGGVGEVVPTYALDEVVELHHVVDLVEEAPPPPPITASVRVADDGVDAETVPPSGGLHSHTSAGGYAIRGSTSGTAAVAVTCEDPEDRPKSQVDVVFVVDVSTTMGFMLDKVERGISEVDAAVREVSVEPHYGLVVFVDDVLVANEGKPYASVADLRAELTRWRTFTASNREIQSAESNLDWPENSLDALHAAATRFDWRPADSTLRLVVHATDDDFGEAPAIQSGQKIQHTYRETVSALRSAQVRVTTFAARLGGQCECLDVKPGLLASFRGRPSIPSATGGAAFDIDEVAGGSLSFAAAVKSTIGGTICKGYPASPKKSQPKPPTPKVPAEWVGTVEAGQ